MTCRWQPFSCYKNAVNKTVVFCYRNRFILGILIFLLVFHYHLLYTLVTGMASSDTSKAGTAVLTKNVRPLKTILEP